MSWGRKEVLKLGFGALGFLFAKSAKHPQDRNPPCDSLEKNGLLIG